MSAKKPKKIILKVDNITVQRPFGGPILENISFDVYEGEFLSIVGASGGGKSTLLRSLAGLFPPVSGKIYFRDEEMRAPRVEVGLVYQSYALFPWRTALENVEFGLELRNIPRVKRRQVAVEALELMGLSEDKDKFPIELSGGMQQRVAIAREIVNKPKVLMLDEGFSALDVQTCRQTEEQLLHLQAKFKMTIILVTHMLEQALALSDRVIVISDGEIKETLELDGGKRPRDIDQPEFRKLLRSTEALIRPTPKIEMFVRDLAGV